jgi:hypothetical protein
MLNIALYGHAAFKRQLATSFLEHSVRRFPLTSPSSDTASNSDHPNSAAPCAESSVAASSSCDAGPPLLAPLAIHLDLLPAAHAQDSANWIQTDRPLAGPELSKLARFQTNLIGLRSLLDCGGPFMIGPTQQLQGRRAFSTESTIDIFDRFANTLSPRLVTLHKLSRLHRSISSIPNAMATFNHNTSVFADHDWGRPVVHCEIASVNVIVIVAANCLELCMDLCAGSGPSNDVSGIVPLDCSAQMTPYW